MRYGYGVELRHMWSLKSLNHAINMRSRALLCVLIRIICCVIVTFLETENPIAPQRQRLILWYWCYLPIDRNSSFYLLRDRDPTIYYFFRRDGIFLWIIIVSVTYGASVLLAFICFVDSYWWYPVCLHMGVQFWKWEVLWWSGFFSEEMNVIFH